MDDRQELFGAKTPWNLMRWWRGGGIRHIIFSINSSWENFTWVVPSLKGFLSSYKIEPSEFFVKRDSAIAGLAV